jgi:hypothetical protein
MAKATQYTKVNRSGFTAEELADFELTPEYMSDAMRELEAIAGERGIRFTTYESGSFDTSVRTRYKAPGTRSGRGYVRKVSDKQVRFIANLMRSRDTRNLVVLPGGEDFRNMSLTGARDLIDRLLACPELPKAEQVRIPATSAQVGYLQTLTTIHAYDGRTDFESLTKEGASTLITQVKTLPKRVAQAPTRSASDGSERKLMTSGNEITDGIYERPDGVIVKVQIAKQGSGNLYGKRLNIETGKFEYAQGIMRTLKAEYRMSLEKAQEYGRLYGICIVCGRDLTDEESIARGIGPICADKF